MFAHRVLLIAFLSLAAAPSTRAEPIRTHPENPRYFLFQGKPTILITSGEHYGAVLNREFDFEPYLDELQRRGLNLTRTFSGTYLEVHGSFKIQNNTLAPPLDQYQSPWAKKDGKHDLDQFDPAYFERLKAFLKAADQRGVVVELVLFCTLYNDDLWAINPMNARNNVNGVGDCTRQEVYTLKHPELLKRQLAFVERVVKELNGCDNLYYEICNEPYFQGVALDWQARVAATIVETEKDLPNKHLIAQNIANGKAKIENPDPNVTIFNFHYATPPDVVAMNAHLNKPIGDDETGFRGTGDRVYRTEAWEFLLAGGSTFSNLDYSFTADHEDGSAKVVDPTPGGGGPVLRAQLAFLKTWLERFDFLRMRPDDGSITIARGEPDNGARVWTLAEPGQQYAAYLRGGKNIALKIALPDGSYTYELADPRNGETLGNGQFTIQGGHHTLGLPDLAEDVALSIRRAPS